MNEGRVTLFVICQRKHVARGRVETCPDVSDKLRPSLPCPAPPLISIICIKVIAEGGAGGGCGIISITFCFSRPKVHFWEKEKMDCLID